MHASDGRGASIFKEITSTFTVLTIFITTLSVALFNYIDNISKEIIEINADQNKINHATQSLTLLKKEVVANAVLIIALLVIQLTIKGISDSLQGEYTPFENFHLMTLSVRFTLFVLAIYAAIEQVRGFFVAIEYRNIIHNKK